MTERRATYRLQLHAEFPFAAAAAQASYLRDLGVSHVYCSPVVQAAPGSRHGYDVVDPARVSDDLGGAEGFAQLRSAAARHDLSLLIDIVPNHMAAHHANPWWWDVLRHGQRSAFARHFDVDWDSVLDPSTRRRVLLCVLGDHIGRVVERGDVRVARRDDGAVVVRHFDAQAPLPEMSDAEVDAVNADPAALLALLDAQPYRLAWWRLGLRVLNYRRFFDISGLVALRAEQPETFDATHALVLDLLRRGDVDGLRVDHVDGLRDPAAYLRRLRAAAGDDAWLLVEKILADGEEPPDDWPVDGTTGYEFAAVTTRLFVHPAGEAPLFALHAELGGPTDLDAASRDAKLQVLRESLVPDVERLTLLLARVCALLPRHRDHARNVLREAVCEVIAALDVYRTYATPGHDASAFDAERVGCAVARVRAVRPDMDVELLDLIRAQVVHAVSRDDEFVARFQQLCAAAMAKGLEDTTFYRVTPLLALDEVGCAPQPFSAPAEDLHRHNLRIQQRHPATLLALSTHDTKRSADVRARLAVLSEMPEQWAARVRAWRGRNARYRREGMPDAVMEHVVYQSMVGAWPVDRERLRVCMEKSAREAKVHTSWLDPSPEYERALMGFVDALYDDREFLGEVEELVQAVLEPGRVNALAMALLQLTSPGVPDVYQGCEVWNLALVDPDNRRPVDFAARAELMRHSREVSGRDAWLHDRDSGLPKLLLTRRALALRRRHPELFDARGEYRPLRVTGAKVEHVVAFARGATPGAVTVVPRWTLRLGGSWGDTAVELPDGDWHDQLTGAVVQGGVAPARVAELLRDVPVALLAREPTRDPMPDDVPA